MLKGGLLIAKIHYMAGRILSKKFKEEQLEEINHAQGRILFALWQHNGCTVQELASITALNVSSLSLMLDRLQEAGHIRREPHLKDKRKTLVFYEDACHDLKHRYELVVNGLANVFYQGFNKEEVTMAERLLERIYNNLSCYGAQRKGEHDEQM